MTRDALFPCFCTCRLNDSTSHVCAILRPLQSSQCVTCFYGFISQHVLELRLGNDGFNPRMEGGLCRHSLA